MKPINPKNVSPACTLCSLTDIGLSLALVVLCATLGSLLAEWLS